MNWFALMKSGCSLQTLDLTQPPPELPRWWLGRYDEVRSGMYLTDLFGGERCLHLGIDMGGPAGTEVFAFGPGEVIHAGYNSAAGDYGHVLVTAHRVADRPLYALWGHLSKGSLAVSPVGRRFEGGEGLGWLGEQSENGGWAPHLHFQLSWTRPQTHDMPGVVRPQDRESALAMYPDPLMVLGNSILPA